jgi:hypothetical protein
VFPDAAVSKNIPAAEWWRGSDGGERAANLIRRAHKAQIKTLASDTRARDASSGPRRVCRMS